MLRAATSLARGRKGEERRGREQREKIEVKGNRKERGGEEKKKRKKRETCG
jgi:hypothetical protein